MSTNFDQEVAIDCNKWNTTAIWAQREKYFLFLRDHPLRLAWRHDVDCDNIDIDDMLNYEKFYKKIIAIGIDIDAFQPLWTQWYQSNKNILNR